MDDGECQEGLKGIKAWRRVGYVSGVKTIADRSDITLVEVELAAEGGKVFFGE